MPNNACGPEPKISMKTAFATPHQKQFDSCQIMHVGLNLKWMKTAFATHHQKLFESCRIMHVGLNLKWIKTALATHHQKCLIHAK